jgi:beta-N-acetylhexosaminidase
MRKTLPFGPVMIDLDGLTLQETEKDKITHPNTGAVILFSRNFDNPEQASELIAQIRASRNGPLLITVDQEGGRVQRFQSGFTRLPPATTYANKPELAQGSGWLMAAELLAIGIDFSFAPVLDVDCGISEIIGDRAFSTDFMQVAELASAFRKGMRAAGMAAVGKHFPGHGAISLDSHLTLPVDKRDFDSINNKDLNPFKRLIAEGLEGIMPAHVLYPLMDAEPAGFSEFWIQQVLRQQLGFNGAVFSDDLSMEGAACVGNYFERAGLALQAGCDMVLVCNNSAAAEQVLDTLPQKASAIRETRLSRMLGKPSMTRTELEQTSQWQLLSQQLSGASDYA